MHAVKYVLRRASGYLGDIVESHAANGAEMEISWMKARAETLSLPKLNVFELPVKSYNKGMSSVGLTIRTAGEFGVGRRADEKLIIKL